MLLKGQFETSQIVWTTENLVIPGTAFSLHKHSNSQGAENDFNKHYETCILVLL